MTTPPFSSPDESSHYLRALGLGQGQLVGTPVEDFPDPWLTPAQKQWVLMSARQVDVPPHLDPTGFACNAFESERSAACLYSLPPPPAHGTRAVAANGTYQPAPYALQGWLMVTLASRPDTGLLLGRLVSALLCMSLLALAAYNLDPPGTSDLALLGLALATTPMVLFIGSMLNPSGPEIAASLALVAGLVRLARDPSSASRGWLALAVGGASVCVSRSLGVLWLALFVGLWGAFCGPKRCLELARNAKRKAALSALALCAGVGVNRAWEAAHGPTLRFEPGDWIGSIGRALPRLPDWLAEAVGIFQYLETPMPSVTYRIWYAVALVVLATAFALADLRARLMLVALAGASVAAPVLLQAFILDPYEWTAQARHVLPVAVALPVFAGEVLRAARGRVSEAVRRWGLRAAFAAVAGVQLTALAVNARRSAVGLYGPWSFPLHGSQWSPPLGWLPWAGLALIAALLFAAAGFATRRASPQ